MSPSLAGNDDDNPNEFAVATGGPFSLLPPELVIQIFMLCSHTGDPLIPLALASVCKWWREICMSSPRVWQVIVVSTMSRSISSIRTQAELWIVRSHPLPFDVQIHLADCEAFLPVLSYFLPHISRWRGCQVTFEGHALQTYFPGPCQSSVHIALHHLDMQLRRPIDEDEDEDEDADIAVSKLPSAQLLSPLRFTSLNISESSFRYAVRSPPLLHFLQQCPNLECFSLRGVCYEEGILNTPPSVVVLPRLHTLTLDLLCIQRSVLSHLHLPALRELHLRQLNMDFSLDGYHVEEPGDSDDEAHDFSQSPSSDHHTGMGLRRLISRSQPPLEILDMNLSDMRTKDFAWVFDRVPHLKQFSIVGSDMSDKVVRFFGPVSISGGRSAFAPMRLRLPQLATLKLISCRQFSGDALVDALTTRTQYTDIRTPNETLQGWSLEAASDSNQITNRSFSGT